MTPPASTEPVFGILLSELYEWERENLCWSEVQDLQRRIRARGPVQQAPAGPCNDCTDPNQCYVPCHQVPKNPCIERGCTDIEDCDEICVHSRIFSPNWVKEHDAALIAQEREKWEREHTPKYHAENPDAFSPWYNVEMVAARVRSAEKKAREDVLDELAQMYANVPEQFLEGTYRLHSEWKEKIESLRHGQKQERDPE